MSSRTKNDLINEIEKKREDDDELYKLLFSSDVHFINNYVNSVSQLIQKKYKTSDRLKNILQTISITPNRAIKHALLFFALYLEETFLEHSGVTVDEYIKYAQDNNLKEKYIDAGKV